ncbi:hypothetical protein GJ496_011469 [Pomphorhynchus laevis]|nr:hypothetical protein GJ496_011469 [Pomphorhynchus laevis]
MSYETKVFRCKLPIYEHRNMILSSLKENSIIIITGETACGKTTQLPQYILESFNSVRGLIGCTQPRRIAAISVAKRVAFEKGCVVGKLVGYSVRFNNNVCNETKLKYMSDGMLIREAINDPLLLKYSFIILDEVHERSLNTDILCSITRHAQSERFKQKNLQQLKIVLMSATMNPHEFQKYFGDNNQFNIPVIHVKGRLFPVRVKHLIDDNKITDIDYEHKSIVTLIKVNREFPCNYGVLIFLTGQEEIEHYGMLLEKLQDQFIADNDIGLDVSLLYANMSSAAQLKALRLPREGMRKVIVATNVAESSITIPNIRIVIDCGWVKRKQYNHENGVDTLKLQMISQAEAWQRTGRAGRESIGYCYRMYQEEIFKSLSEELQPELLRANLAATYLQLIAMGFKDPSTFQFMSAPSDESTIFAINQLEQLGCIITDVDSKSHVYHLTPLGLNIVSFPLDPRLAKCIMTAHALGCLRSMIRIVSILSVESILQFSSKRGQSKKELEKFSNEIGDHLTYLKIFNSFRKAPNPKIKWCKQYHLNYRNLHQAVQISKHLRKICATNGMDLSNSIFCRASILKSLCSGFILQTAKHYRERFYRTINGNVSVLIHPSSVLFRSKPDIIVFRELVHSNKRYVRVVSAVSADVIKSVCPPTLLAKLNRFV